MNRAASLAISLTGLVVGCLLVLGSAVGQDRPIAGKAKKEARWDQEIDREAKAIFKTAEKATRIDGETERDRWLNELNKVFPGQMNRGLTRDDFSQWFELLAGNAPTWRRDAAPKKALAELFDRASTRLGLDEVQALRRDEFLAYAQRFLSPIDSPLWKPADSAVTADKVFRDLDRDRSGTLDAPEWTDSLRGVSRRVDVNRDGQIDRDEYRSYFENRVSSAIENLSNGNKRDSLSELPFKKIQNEPAQIETRPGVAVRYGKLPEGLPTWFATLDTDHDAQVALHEWRKSGRTLDEFTTMDLDGDGLVTPDEWLRYERDRKRTIAGVPEVTTPQKAEKQKR
jgi:hypothetical protein